MQPRLSNLHGVLSTRDASAGDKTPGPLSQPRLRQEPGGQRGHARLARPRRLPHRRGARRCGRGGGQHLLFYPAGQGGVDRYDPGARRAEARRSSQSAGRRGLLASALRPGAGEGAPRGGRVRGDRGLSGHREHPGPGARRRRERRIRGCRPHPPLRRKQPAAADRPPAQRLRQDRGGL